MKKLRVDWTQRMFVIRYGNFSFRFAVQKHKGWNKHNCDFTVAYGCETWSLKLRGKQAEGVEENIWAWEVRGNRGLDKTT